MAPLDLTPLLRSALLELPDAVPAAIQSVAVDVGASDVVVYLVDFGQLYLEPLGNYAAHAELLGRKGLPVASLADVGRAWDQALALPLSASRANSVSSAPRVKSKFRRPAA